MSRVVYANTVTYLCNENIPFCSMSKVHLYGSTAIEVVAAVCFMESRDVRSLEVNNIQCMENRGISSMEINNLQVQW